MSEKEEWSEWFEHDGKGCPDNVVGRQIECVVRRWEPAPPVQLDDIQYRCSAPWLWAIVPCSYEIIRYRIRKPRGLTILENLITDLPAPVGKVDA